VIRRKFMKYGFPACGRTGQRAKKSVTNKRKRLILPGITRQRPAIASEIMFLRWQVQLAGDEK
jgi:hypothetical protein